MLKSSSLCGMVHGSDQGGATDKNSHEAREARHDEIESDLVGTAAVGGPDPPVLHSGKRACALAGRRWMRYS
jgi:hypothetical protein